MKPHSRTWVGQIVTDEVTLQSLLDASLANVAEAARKQAEYQALFDRLPPGDPRIVGTGREPPLGYHITREADNQRHWREYAAHYRARIAKEGRGAMAIIQMLRRHRQPTLELVPLTDEPEPEPGGEVPF